PAEGQETGERQPEIPAEESETGERRPEIPAGKSRLLRACRVGRASGIFAPQAFPSMKRFLPLLLLAIVFFAACNKAENGAFARVVCEPGDGGGDRQHADG